MCSRRAEKTDADGAPGFGSFKTWSITGRLTFLYTLSTFGMLLVATGFLHWALTSNLEREDNQFLADKVHVLRAILGERPADSSALEEEVKWEGVTFRFTKYYARVLDRHGRSLIETSGMGDVLAVSLFPSPVGVEQLPRKGVSRALAGRSYLMMAARARTGNGRQRIIQVALDMSRENDLIADYRKKLALVLFLGILLSAGFGVASARRGMRPLQEITRKAQLITSSQLHERVDAARWPRELTALAQALDDMLDRLEDSFGRLSQFSADLAHELRTPINNLMGEAEVALSRARSAEEYRQVLESGLEEYARLSHTIDSLLFLTRAESAKMQIARETLDLRQEFETVREFHDAVAAERGVETSCTGDARIGADPTLLRRALSNLLGNALQHTPPGGKIVLSATGLPDRSAEVRIADTGCGIEPQHLDKIFDRFYRADSARSANSPGTGLGLAIVKSIMSLHGGTVAVHSEPRRGTTVTLRFPPAPVRRV